MVKRDFPKLDIWRACCHTRNSCFLSRCHFEEKSALVGILVSLSDLYEQRSVFVWQTQNERNKPAPADDGHICGSFCFVLVFWRGTWYIISLLHLSHYRLMKKSCKTFLKNTKPHKNQSSRWTGSEFGLSRCRLFFEHVCAQRGNGKSWSLILGAAYHSTWMPSKMSRGLNGTVEPFYWQNVPVILKIKTEAFTCMYVHMHEEIHAAVGYAFKSCCNYGRMWFVMKGNRKMQFAVSTDTSTSVALDHAQQIACTENSPRTCRQNHWSEKRIFCVESWLLKTTAWAHWSVDIATTRDLGLVSREGLPCCGQNCSCTKRRGRNATRFCKHLREFLVPKMVVLDRKDAWGEVCVIFSHVEIVIRRQAVRVRQSRQTWTRRAYACSLKFSVSIWEGTSWEELEECFLSLCSHTQKTNILLSFRMKNSQPAMGSSQLLREQTDLMDGTSTVCRLHLHENTLLLRWRSHRTSNL